jgi:hypothetical protein
MPKEPCWKRNAQGNALCLFIDMVRYLYSKVNLSVQDSSGRLLVLPPSACKHATLLSGVPRFVERPRQIALAKKGERSVGSVGARAPPKYKVCPLPTVRKPRYLHRTAHEIFEISILRLFIGFRILAGRARLKASLFPHRR